MTGPAIIADELRKSFGGVDAVKGISIEVPTGSVLGLLGANGAGKTTMVRMLTTVLKPDGGRGTVNGFDIVTHPQEVRRSIGLAGQFAAVDENLTGRENLVLVGQLSHIGTARARTEAARLLDRFRLADAADRPARTYSGGMRRRLDLAAALVASPPVLFLDEPTTGLDPTSRLDLWDVIESLVADGTTVLLTTQYLEEADRLADRIVMIDQGSVAAEGTAAELKATIGTTSIEFEFANDDEAQRGATALHTTATASTVVRLPMANGASTLRAALNTLDAVGLTPSNVALREPSLDDVFLLLTGATTSSAHTAGADAEGASS